MSSYAPTEAGTMLESVFINTALGHEKESINTVTTMFCIPYISFFLLVLS